MRAWIIGVALWAGALGLAGVGIAHAPGGQCEDANHDAFIVAANHAGTFFGCATLLGALATPFIFVGAFGRRTRRAKILFALAGLASVGLTTLLALSTLANLVFRCLE